MPYDGDFSGDFEFQERFLEHQQELARQALRVEVAPVEEDMRRNTDLVVQSAVPLTKGPIRVSARVRRHKYRSNTKYRSQITQRIRRPSGVPTEVDKVLEGHGDVFIYGFESEPGSRRLDPYVAVNLHMVKDYILAGGYKEEHKNKGSYGSALAAIHLADLPLGAILVSGGLPTRSPGASMREQGTCDIFDRDKAWHQCRRCFSRHVEAEKTKFQAGEGYWRHCFWCDFHWKAGWIAPMTRKVS